LVQAVQHLVFLERQVVILLLQQLSQLVALLQEFMATKPWVLLVVQVLVVKDSAQATLVFRE
jgi:hypothetical protein